MRPLVTNAVFRDLTATTPSCSQRNRQKDTNDQGESALGVLLQAVPIAARVGCRW
jgi:hypothetical protein